MAKTYGYALSGLASGFAAGFSMRMEKAKIDALKAEQKRLEEAKKEAEKIFQEWYDSPETKEFVTNLDTAPQGERAYFITGLINISKDVFEYFTEIDNDIREGNIAKAKSKNDLLIQKIKSAQDLAKIGMKATFPDGSPMKISDEDLRYGKMKEVYKETPSTVMPYEMTKEMAGVAGFEGMPGTMPVTPIKIGDLDSALGFMSKYIGNPKFESVANMISKTYKIERSLLTEEAARSWLEQKQYVKPTITGEFRATPLDTQEKYIQGALGANTWADAKEITNRYTKAGYDPTEMPTKQDWTTSKLEQLDSLVEMLEGITNEEGRLMGSKSFNFLLGDEEETKTGEEWYKTIYESYKFYLEELRKMNIDVSKYLKIKAPGEVSKVGFLKGMFTGGGVERGYPSIYYK